MQATIPTILNPAILRIQGLLRKTDQLKLPARSRRDVECILVHQVSREIDRALPWQAGHGKRTAAIARALGQTAGLDADALHQIKLAALLHDIGLLMLSPDLTKDRDVLDPDSYIAIQHHARLGANVLEPFVFLQEATVLIAHHHERWDGSGYPYGIRGAYIPLGARILAIADAFDSIRIPDVTDQSLRHRIAFRVLRVASGTQFDPQLVNRLHEIIHPAIPSELDRFVNSRSNPTLL